MEFKHCLLRQDQVLLIKTESTRNFPLPGTDTRTKEERTGCNYVILTVFALSDIAEYLNSS